MGKAKGTILALVSSGTFGLIPLFTLPLIQSGVHPSSILLYRSLFSAIFLFAYCLLRGHSLKLSRGAVKQLFVMGILYALTALGFFYSFKYLSSGIATTIHFLYPIIVAILMIVIYKERASKEIFLAAILSVVGVGLLCWQGNSFVNPIGLAIILFAVCTYAVYIVKLNRPELRGLAPEVIMFYVMLFGTISVSLYAIPEGGMTSLPTANAYLNILGLTLFSTLLSGLALIKAVQLAGSTITSILGSMESVVATIIGIIYFNEPFGINSLFGFSLILLAVSMVVIVNQRKQSKKVSLSA